MNIREATLDDAVEVARVHVDSWRTAYRGIVPDAHLEGLSYEESERRWERLLAETGARGFTYVACESDGRIVGFANGGRERTGDAVYRGELYAIYLLAEHRRRGTGRALARRVVEHLLRLNLDSMLVWVLAANPSTRFYESLGGRKVYEQSIEIGGVVLPELAYGWKDIRDILRAEA